MVLAAISGSSPGVNPHFTYLGAFMDHYRQDNVAGWVKLMPWHRDQGRVLCGRERLAR